MANYNVDIAIALKNSNKLMQLRKELKGATDNIREFNKEAGKQNKIAVSTFGKLNKQISRARSLLDKAAIGTSSFTRAARVAVSVEKEMNLQLRQKEKLLAKIRAESVTAGQQIVIDRTAKTRQIKSGFAGFSARANEVSKSARIEAIKNKARDKHLKNIDNKVAKIATIQTQQQTFAGGIGAQFGVPGGRIGPALPKGFRLRQQFAPGGAFFNQKGTAGRISSGLQSGLIGGGFPLLFGQGGAGAIAGGLGGALGGALSPGLGFAGSIAATAITQQIKESIDFRKSVAELNKEMEKMGITSNISSKSVIDLGKSLGITKQEAVQTLQEFKRFGKDAVLFAEKFKGDFGKFEAVGQATDIESTLAAIKKFNKDLTLEEELRFIRSLRIKGAERTINDLLTDSLDKQKQLETKGFGQGEGLNPGANRKRKSVLDQEKEATQDIIDKNTELVEKLKNVRDLNRQIKEESIMASISISETMKDLNFEMKKLNNRQFQVIEFSKAMGASFEESFKGIIKGTMSVGDAFRNMLNRMADHFLDMAAKMLATQFQRGILSLIGNSLTGGFGGGGGIGDVPFVVPDTPLVPMPTGLSLSGKAMGGPVKGGGSYIVGEKGPELFTPGVSGMVTPNHALGGSTNVVVNVDASGNQQVQGDDGKAEQFGEAIAAAVQAEIIIQQMAGGLLS